MKHLTIVNKNAGNYSEWETTRLQEVLRSSPHYLEGVMMVTPDVAKLEELIEEYADFNPDIIGIAGGDGTYAKTMTLLAQHWKKVPPMVALYPMGTMNFLSTACGVPGSTADRLRRNCILIPIQLILHVIFVIVQKDMIFRALNQLG